jgi:hypothetical protein
MSTTSEVHRGSETVQASSQRLLASSERLSYEPDEEIDWSAPLPERHYGLTPEWSTLYGTALWDELTESQRIALTRHEVGSVMTTGIWFEMILQQMILRDQYVKNPANAEFQFALTEIADECRHSLMFARATQRLGVPAHLPPRWVGELGRFFKTTAGGVVAYGGTLVAEEVLDVLQRDMMRDERVLDLVRTTSKIHVTEESRHMKFARDEIHARVQWLGPVRRHLSAIGIAAVSYFIVSNLVNARVYESVGLDRERAVAAAKANEHHKSVMRTACGGLMQFMAQAGLLNKVAVWIYRQVDMI